MDRKDCSPVFISTSVWNWKRALTCDEHTSVLTSGCSECKSKHLLITLRGVKLSGGTVFVQRSGWINYQIYSVVVRIPEISIFFYAGGRSC